MDNSYFELFEHLYRGENLSQTQSNRVFTDVLAGELNNTEITALLISLKLKGETSDEIAGAAQAMRDSAVDFPSPNYDFSDLVGTGGDGHNTINISSAAAVVSAACGLKVAKHGNRSVSSKSGSSDLFAGFGVNLGMSPATARKCLDEAGFCFLAAPMYHLGMRHVMPIRAGLKTRTLFNVLGPLANPAKPNHGVYGVYRPELLKVYSDSLLNMGHKNAMVVHGSGLDEVALHGPSEVIHIREGEANYMHISPEDFGIKPAPLEAIQGDSPEYNVDAIAQVFEGKGKEAHVNAIAMNAACLLFVNQYQTTLTKCFEQVMDTIASGQAMKTISLAARLSEEDFC